jgi:hypothetical protein
LFHGTTTSLAMPAAWLTWWQELPKQIFSQYKEVLPLGAPLFFAKQA